MSGASAFRSGTASSAGPTLGGGRAAARRRRDWPARLAAFLEERHALPFAWGAHDCCLFAADAILEMTGHDFAAEFRGRYDSALAAARLAPGPGTHGDPFGVIALAAATGLEPIAIERAGRGDLIAAEAPCRVVAFEDRDLTALAICTGAHAAAPGLHGLIYLTRERWKLAWKV